LNPSIKYILQHVVKISANLEMVEREAFVELSLNDPKLFPQCLQHFIVFRVLLCAQLFL